MHHKKVTKRRENYIKCLKNQNEIKEALNKKPRILITEYYSCKTRKKIVRNTTVSTKTGKTQLDLLQKTKIEMINIIYRCNKNGQESIIDYVLVKKQDLKNIVEETIGKNVTIQNR